MRSLALSSVFALNLVLCGCNSAPRLDTSSEAAIDASLEKMNAELTDEKRQELERSIAILTLPRVNQNQTSITSALTADAPPISRTDVYQPLNGKTAEEIIQQARPSLAKMAGAR
jgi:hypothetical protein